MEPKFLEPNIDSLSRVVKSLWKVQVERFLKLILNNIQIDAGAAIHKEFRKPTGWNNIKISHYYDSLLNLLLTEKYRKEILKLFKSDEKTYFLYNHLVWECKKAWYDNEMLKKLDIDYKNIKNRDLPLPGIRALINHNNLDSSYHSENNCLYIDSKIRRILKYILELPENYYLTSVEPKESDFKYNNENGVFSYINTFSDMILNSIEICSKNSEKPLLKSLQMLKSSTLVNEFFPEKQNALLASDMLARSFSCISIKDLKSNDKKDILKSFIINELDCVYDFYISRMFVSHLKGVRFDRMTSSERGLFDILKAIITDLPENSYVDIDSIFLFCKYRDFRFHLEDSDKTCSYRFQGRDISDDDHMFFEDMEYNPYDKDYYHLFFNPVIKGALFYLASLGVLEIRYNYPETNEGIVQSKYPYVSLWDGLKYIKLTDFGRYVFGFSNTYSPPKEQNSTNKSIKLDEFKPIITLDPKDTIVIAKLDSYCEKIDEGRYTLSYSKIFKDCNNYKTLDQKIKNFSTILGCELPSVFNDFLEKIRDRANLLSRDLKMITIELEDDKELLNLFATNKKLQELVVKAQGYRVLIQKENIPKMRKILGDNGFFIDF